MNFSRRNDTQIIIIRIACRLLLMAVVGLPLQAIAEMQMDMGAKDGSTKDVDELSKELVNPIGSNWVINSYVNVNRKSGTVSTDSRTVTELLFQPVMPIPLDDKPMGLTLMNRPTLPILANNPVPQTNALGEFSGYDNVTGVGDLMLMSAIGSMPKASFGMYMWGIGLSLMFPTATSDEIGSGKYSAGPSGMLVGYTENLTFGTVVSHVWSYAGDNDRMDVNMSQFQPIYIMQLDNGWQIGDNPTWTTRWDASSGDKYDVPIGLGIFKTMYIGKRAWRFGVTPRYYVKSYESWGNDWTVSFTITPVLTNPFK
ncbi:MAG: hypothetical protein ACC707_00075 [Thiohalomonadales bacterium]